MSTMDKEYIVGYRTEGNLTIPTYVILRVNANDDDEDVIFRGRGGRQYGLYRPDPGDHYIDLSNLGYANDNSLTIETVALSLKVSIGSDKKVPVLVGVAVTFPDAPVDVTNFSFTAWDATTGVTFDEETQVSGGSNPIKWYRISDNETFFLRIAVEDLPFTFRLSPDTYIGWPQDDADGSFNIPLYVSAETDDGIGPQSAVRNIAVNCVDSFRIDPADITVTSVDDQGQAGLVSVAFAGGSGFALVPPYDVMELYVMDLPADTDAVTLLPLDWAFSKVPVIIAKGDTKLVQSNVAVGQDAYVTILGKRSDTNEHTLLLYPQTVEILPLAISTPPAVTSGPTITGTVVHGTVTAADINQAVSGNTTWDDVDSYTNQFMVDDVLVGSQAVGGPASFTGSAGQNQKTLKLFSTGTKGALTSQVTSNGIPILYKKPTVIGSLTAISNAYGTGNVSISAATVQALFGNAVGGAYTITGGLDNTIDANTGAVVLADPAAARSDTINITYANSGGSATVPVGVSWTTPADTFLLNIAPGDWTFREAAQSEGFAEFTVIGHLGNVTFPTDGNGNPLYGARLQVEKDALTDLSGLTTTQKNQATMAISPNSDTVWTKTGPFAKDNNIKATIQRREFLDEDWRPVDTKFVVLNGFGTVIQPPSGWIDPTTAMLADATGRSKETFNSSDTSTNAGGFCGSSFGVIAYAAFAGNSSLDSTVIACINAALPGNKCPACNSGFSMQFETNNWFLGVTLAKLTPRIWNTLPAATVATIDVLFEAEAIAAAWASSDTRKANAQKTDTANWKSKTTRLDGGGNNYTWGNINYKMAPPYLLSLYGIYLGDPQLVKTFLNGGNFSSVITAVQNKSLTNPGNGSFTSSRTGKPSVTEVNTSCNNWTWAGISVTDPVGLFNKLMQLNFSENCFLHHPNTADIGGRGALIGGDAAADSKLLSLVGQLGMPDELKATDGNGVRTSVTYAMDGIRMSWGWTIAMLASGFLGKNSTTLLNLHDRMDNGYEWILHAATVGWKNYAKGGTGGGNGDFKLSLPGNGSPTIDKQYAVTYYNIPMWTTVIEPMIGA